MISGETLKLLKADKRRIDQQLSACRFAILRKSPVKKEDLELSRETSRNA